MKFNESTIWEETGGFKNNFRFLLPFYLIILVEVSLNLIVDE